MQNESNSLKLAGEGPPGERNDEQIETSVSPSRLSDVSASRQRNIVLIDGAMLRSIGKQVPPQLVDTRNPSAPQRKKWEQSSPAQQAALSSDIRFQNEVIVTRLSDAAAIDRQRIAGLKDPTVDELDHLYQNAEPGCPELQIALMATNRSLIAMMIAVEEAGMLPLPVTTTNADEVAPGGSPFDRSRLTAFLMTRVAYLVNDPTVASIYVVTDDITAAKNLLAGILGFHDSLDCPSVNFMRFDVDRVGEFPGNAITSAPFNPDTQRSTDYLLSEHRLPSENPPEHFHDNQRAAYPRAINRFHGAVSLPPRHGRVINIGVHGGLFFRTDYQRPVRVLPDSRNMQVSGSSLRIPSSTVSQ